jgi:hypothetical protein
MELSVLQQAGLSGTFIAVVLIVYRLLKLANNHKIVSDCCGKRLSIGLRVDEMNQSPPPIIIPIDITENPLNERRVQS